MPQPWNNTARRFGNWLAAATAASAPQTGMDSSHGNAIATPTPRSMVRREIRYARAFLRSFMSIILLCRAALAAFVQELRACDNGIDHRVKTEAVGLQIMAHLLDGCLVRNQQ